MVNSIVAQCETLSPNKGMIRVETSHLVPLPSYSGLYCFLEDSHGEALLDQHADCVHQASAVRVKEAALASQQQVRAILVDSLLMRLKKRRRSWRNRRTDRRNEPLAQQKLKRLHARMSRLRAASDLCRAAGTSVEPEPTFKPDNSQCSSLQVQRILPTEARVGAKVRVWGVGFDHHSQVRLAIDDGSTPQTFFPHTHLVDQGRLWFRVPDVEGNYQGLLTIVSTGCSAESNSVELLIQDSQTGDTQDLEASFNASPTFGIAPLQVQFEDASQGSVQSWQWDFGDGSSSTLSSPQHIYHDPGTYSVSLTISDQNGSATTVIENMITVTNEQSQSCPATNARENLPGDPFKIAAVDYVPVVSDDTLGFYRVYSTRQQYGIPNNNVAIDVFDKGNGEILIFGAGYGDRSEAYFSADFDAELVAEVVEQCLGYTLSQVIVYFASPHPHEDHWNAWFLHALETLGMTITKIYFHQGSSWLITNKGYWTTEDRAKFHPLTGGMPGACGAELLSIATTVGKVWFRWRANHHTSGGIDAIIDVQNDPSDRIRILGTLPGGDCAQRPMGTRLTIKAHGNALIGGS